MAITGYFVNNDWEYCEVFLEFELLYSLYTESNLNSVVINILENYQITDRILSITTDNTTNNNTIINSIQEKIKVQEIGNTGVFRILCLVYIIQLSFNQLLGKIKAVSINNKTEIEWSNKYIYSIYPKRTNREIVDTLNKVSLFFSLLLQDH